MRARWIPWGAALVLGMLVAGRMAFRSARPAQPVSLEALAVTRGEAGDLRVVLRLVNHTREPLECLGRDPVTPLVWVVPSEREAGPAPGQAVAPSALVPLPARSSLVFTQSVPAGVARFRLTVNPRPDPARLRYRLLALAGSVSPELVRRWWPDPILASTPELEGGPAGASGQTL